MSDEPVFLAENERIVTVEWVDSVLRVVQAARVLVDSEAYRSHVGGVVYVDLEALDLLAERLRLTP